MKRAQSLLLTGILCWMVIILAACGSASNAGTSGQAKAAATLPTYAQGSGPRTGSTVTVIGNTGLPIRVYRMMFNGKMQDVLTNSRGMTLYYTTEDKPAAPDSVCTDSCAWDWPPLVVPSGQPTSAVPLPGKLSILVDANGRQVMYNGHPLYLFAVDSGPHQTTGEGEEGDWHVATISLPCIYHSFC